MLSTIQMPRESNAAQAYNSIKGSNRVHHLDYINTVSNTDKICNIFSGSDTRCF